MPANTPDVVAVSTWAPTASVTSITHWNEAPAASDDGTVQPEVLKSESLRAIDVSVTLPLLVTLNRIWPRRRR